MLERLLNEGVISEEFGPFGHPASSPVPGVKEGFPNVPGMFGAGQDSRIAAVTGFGVPPAATIALLSAAI